MPDESDLVRRARGGDEAAFHLLFERHVCPLSGQLDRWLPGLIRRKVSIADILQEVRIVAFQRLPDFEDRGEHSFRNWLYRIAQLKARKAVRRYARTSKRAAGRELSRGARMDTENFLSRGPSPSEAAIATETRDLAQQAMGKLPADYEEIL
ncbi:MAG: RNA polymerase sigma factor, partial [Planctomycetota bacterium]